MPPKWKKPKGKYVLKIKRRSAYLLKAGSYDDGNGESRAQAQTTIRILDAMGFETMKRAEAMQKLLMARYGLETQIVERKVRQKDE